VPAAALMRLGWSPRFDLRTSDQMRAIARLMAPTVFGSAIYLVNMAVSRLVGLSLDDASATVLNLSSRLMELPIGVFAVAVTTVVFPLISRHAAQGDWSGLTDAYRRGMRLILITNIPAAVGLALIAGPVIRVLFQRGAFSSSDTALMTPVLAVYALGLPFVSFVNLALRAFYAEKDTTTPVRAALLSFIVNLVLSLVSMHHLGTLGLALAGNVAIMVQAVYLQSHLSRKRPSLGFSFLLRDVLRIALASLLMGGVVFAWIVGWHRVAGDSLWHQAIEVAVAIALAVPVYGALLWVLRIEGRDEVLAWIKARRGAKKA
jgi:putative peptidoglycan lipid II flippase